MPDLPDESQRLTIKRMLYSHNHRLIVTAAHLAEVEGPGAGNLYQIARFQIRPWRNRRKIDSQQMTIRSAQHR